MKVFFQLCSLIITLTIYNANAGSCDREEMMKGHNPSDNIIFGLGISTNADKKKSREESKQRAYEDIVSQLKSNVESSMTLDETDKSTAYKGTINVTTNVDQIIGVKFFKENKESNHTTCMAYTFDVAVAYHDSLGFMGVLEEKLQGVMTAQKKKNFEEVIRRYHTAKKDLNNNESAILRADMYKTYLTKVGESWWEKFKTAEVRLDKTYDEAKLNIVFYIHEFPKYKAVTLEAETMLGGKGFTVQVAGKKPKKGIELIFKEAGKPRKINGALGLTVVYKIGVIVKDIATGRVLGTNKSSTVQGFSVKGSEEDAYISASNQMSLNVIEAIKSAVPGLIQD